MAETQVTYTVSGDASGREVERAKDRLEDVDGVMGTSVDSDGGELTVRIDADLVSEEQVERQLRDGGIEVE